MSWSRTVVHLDREPDFANQVRAGLKSIGADVISVPGPASLIAELVTAPHRLVLLDIDGPHAKGLKLLRQIKWHDGFAPVIVLTRRPAIAAVIEAFREGAEACFLKPIDCLTPLMEAVEDAFRKLERCWRCLHEITQRREGASDPR